MRQSMTEQNELTQEEKIILLKVARETIIRTTTGQSAPDFSYDSPIFKEKRGAFVTLHKNGELRGCIGYVQPLKPLLFTIIEMAEAASQHDPRFSPVTSQEVNALDIEISVLSPLRQIKDVNEIVTGKHGIFIQRGIGNTGLLLPQVATEYGWDRITFLDATCRKAGLSKEAWQDKNTKIFIFSADVFGEKEYGLRS
jgi:AmmeMemoRadiSam system protein A